MINNNYLRKNFIGALFVFLFLMTPMLADSEGALITTGLINQDPDPAIAGDIVELRISVENIGGKSAENLILELTPEYPFEMVPGENPIQVVGTLNAYQTDNDAKIIKYKIRIDKEAIAGTYELKLWEYEAGEKENLRTQRILNIDISNKENAEIIYIDKVEIIPGKQTNLTFTINNVGSAPLKDLTFSWECESDTILPVGSDNTKYIKDLGVGESVELLYGVIADSNAEAGLYKLSLSLVYEDSITGTSNTVTTKAGLYVGGGTDFDIAFSESSSGITSFTIANIGSNPSFSVSVIIPKQEGWKVSGSNSMIIGNLNKGDYTIASFSLEPLPQAGNPQNSLMIQIAYTNTMGEREIIEKKVSMNTQYLVGDTVNTGMGTRSTRIKPETLYTEYGVYLAALVCLIIFGLLYRKYKKEKLFDPNFRFRDLFLRRSVLKKKSKSR